MPYVLIMKQTGFIQPKSKICQTTRLIDMVNAGGSLQMWNNSDCLNTRDNLYFSSELYTYKLPNRQY